MSEVFHQASGEWNQPGNQSTFVEVANEPPKDQVKGTGTNLFGAGATKPSAVTSGHGQVVRPEETAPKAAEHDEKTEPKKANPFV